MALLTLAALPDADGQHPGDGGDDEGAGHVDRDAMSEQEGQLAQPIRVRDGHVAIAGGEPVRDLEGGVDGAQQRGEVVGPRDGDGDVADRVLEHQVPADDPGHDLAQGRVGVGVGAAGDGDEGGELRVAKAGQRAHRAEKDEGEHERGPRAQPHARFPDRGRAQGREDAGADHRADAEHDEVGGAQRTLEGRAAFRGRGVGRALDLGDALDPEDGHPEPSLQAAHLNTYNEGSFSTRRRPPCWW